jgi:glutamine amidotransferase
MEPVTIVDYKAGNLRSVELAVRHLGREPIVTDDPARIESATRVIFPGVGAAGSALERIRGRGLDEALRAFVATGRPLLGICLGTQIIFEHSEEDDTVCLGILAGRVVRFPELLEEGGARLKVPQMGWNAVRFVRAHPVWEGVECGSEFYFVHAYRPVPAEDELVIGRTRYGVEFASAVARENLVAFQFHPERSGPVGLKVLENFLGWSP